MRKPREPAEKEMTGGMARWKQRGGVQDGAVAPQAHHKVHMLVQPTVQHPYDFLASATIGILT